MNVFDRIKKLTEKKYMTIAQLERKADLGNGTIRRWDNALPSADKLHKVSQILDVSLEYLLNGSVNNFNLNFKESLNEYLSFSVKKKGLKLSEKEMIDFQNICQLKIIDYIDFVVEKNLPT